VAHLHRKSTSLLASAIRNDPTTTSSRQSQLLRFPLTTSLSPPTPPRFLSTPLTAAAEGFCVSSLLSVIPARHSVQPITLVPYLPCTPRRQSQRISHQTHIDNERQQEARPLQAMGRREDGRRGEDWRERRVQIAGDGNGPSPPGYAARINYIYMQY
jgi:hypothetical protein